MLRRSRPWHSDDCLALSRRPRRSRLNSLFLGFFSDSLQTNRRSTQQWPAKTVVRAAHSYFRTIRASINQTSMQQNPTDPWVIYSSDRLTSTKAGASMKWFKKLIRYSPPHASSAA